MQILGFDILVLVYVNHEYIISPYMKCQWESLEIGYVFTIENLGQWEKLYEKPSDVNESWKVLQISADCVV